MEKKIKLIVEENASSCCALRKVYVGSNSRCFICGIDMVAEDVFIANYPQVYGDSFADLVKQILEYAISHKGEILHDIDYLVICDDTEAVTSDEWVEWAKKENVSRLKQSRNPFRNLVWNEGERHWEGFVEVEAF